MAPIFYLFFFLSPFLRALSTTNNSRCCNSLVEGPPVIDEPHQQYWSNRHIELATPSEFCDHPWSSTQASSRHGQSLIIEGSESVPYPLNDCLKNNFGYLRQRTTSIVTCRLRLLSSLTSPDMGLSQTATSSQPLDRSFTARSTMYHRKSRGHFSVIVTIFDHPRCKPGLLSFISTQEIV
ncbi:hypothetical protein PanWU01x14_285020 [Parasponia andersonii]|uniref:Uncharacterized protein n=1 Tax=Parasponia andersonii TaxID=3476 RepID=A0A2P5AZR6_PARAD|nr:hypothetical protein PanWU01x14_285020 [Parasponia andersonii]